MREITTDSWTETDARALGELMFGSPHTGIAFLNSQGHVTRWNRGACFITGFASEEVIGRPISVLFTPEDRQRKLDEHERNTAASVGSAEDERWHMRKDGSRFWSSGSTLQVRDDAGQLSGFVKIFKDATHLRGRMKYLENVVDECNATQRRRDVFVATIAHELRSPLAPLKTALELMRADTDWADRNADTVRIMDRQLGFLEKLVEDLVDLTRVREDKLSITYSAIELQQLLRDALESCRSTAAARRIELHAVLPEVPLRVEVDPERLTQVIVNLLNNAIKFTPPGGAAWLICTADQSHFLCIVRDTGKGIDRDLLPKIFDMFTQAGGADSRRGSGLGIGLALVKKIVVLHGGTIEVRSEGEGKGSEFTVRLPLHGPRAAPEPTPR